MTRTPVQHLGFIPAALLGPAFVTPCDAADTTAPEDRCPTSPIQAVQFETGAQCWVCLMHGHLAERTGELEMALTDCRLSWRMSALQDGEVEEAEAAILRRHLLDCRECNETLGMGLVLDAVASSALGRRRPQQEENEGGRDGT